MYLRDGQPFDISVIQVIGENQYPVGWFFDAEQRAAFGITEVEGPPPTLAELADARAAQWESIKAERDGGRTEGGVLVGGRWYHTDIGSRIKWLGLKDTARDRLLAGALPTEVIVVDGDPVAWKTMSGAFTPVTMQLALDVVEATKVLDKRLFVRAEQHHAAMVASANPAGYDYSTGWPDRYVAG